MKNTVALVAIVIGLVFVASVYYFTRPTTGELSQSMSDRLLNSNFQVSTLSIASANSTSNYFVYTANIPSQLQEGYMNVSTTGNCDNKGNCLGMLFEFSNETNLCFWMDNTYIPLKQTWFNASGYPVYVYNGTVLSKQIVCHYGKDVLETNLNFSVEGYITLNQS